MTINEIEEKSDTMIYKGHSFVINIISNWGNKKKVGMTEIELFDMNNRKIKINNIKIKGIDGIILINHIILMIQLNLMLFLY